jgi:hypothetical protein
MSTKNVKENLADHLAIRDLMDRYTDAVNHRDAAAIESVFCKDGIWDVGGGLEGLTFYFVGAKNVAEGIVTTVNSTELCFQTNHAPVIRVDGKSASARSSINEVARPRGAASGANMLGIYTDDIVLDADGEWRFKKRTFRFVYLETEGLTGQVVSRPGDQNNK